MAINVTQIFSSSPYSLQDERLISPTQIETTFNPSTDYIEYVISTVNNSFQIVDYNYNAYSFPTNGTVTSNDISSIEIDPTSDINRRGITSGEYNTYYNFYKNELLTSPINRDLFIKSISADRTELVIRYTSPTTDPALVVDNFIGNNTSYYFNDFYLNFGDNILLVANNIQVNPTTNDILVNLYNPLPSNLTTNSNFWVVTKIADSLAFNVIFTQEVSPPAVLTFDLKGPNFNLDAKDRTNNTSNYTNYSTIIQGQSTSSINQIKSLLNEKGIEINIDYTDFSNFIHFSSAEQRLNNFYYKVKQIQDYTTDISSLSNVTSSGVSINIIQDKIADIIHNFDEYEYYMYYESGSFTWPKSNSTVPYTLYSTGSAQVLNWFGSSTPTSAYYGGRILSASLYDNNNQDYLFWVIPEYLRDDTRNSPYYSFIDLVGQHYDHIWTYYKDVTNRYDADNRLDYGISKDLVAEALKSFGVKIYQNNFTTENLYSSFLGYGTGSMGINLTPTGSDLITRYVTASYEASITPIDDINKEIYKRLYHNLPYLAKTKGTIPGLRALINCFGVPDTILRISEFGGRDKDTSTYDYFDQQFNYSYSAYRNSQGNKIDTSFILTSSWDPTGASSARPNSVQLRIKPTIPVDFNIEPKQYIFEITGSSGGFFVDLTLTYTGSGLTTGSYSGSAVNPYYQYGTLTLDTKGNGLETASLYLPFFNGDWWSIMINRSGSIGSSTFTLNAGNKLYYDGYDGNQIGYLASSSYLASAAGWEGTNVFFFPSLGISGSAYTTYRTYQGDIQELRYWNTTQSINSFKNYIMDPMSIDTDGENTYSNQLAFRAPLGTTLITGSGFLTSIHPKVTGSWVTTQSFSNGTSTYLIGRNEWNTNVEARFLNSPIIGLRGRVTDKIQIISSSLPTGSVISQYTSIEQSYPSLGSESPDVNMLEVAFSPQNEVNDDIISSLGYFNIGEYIGDPRQVSSSATSYPDLNALSNNFFQKYFDTYDLTDYVRLIKYFDNSLFKMIKDFVPARTSLTTGVVIKQHILERNKYPQPQVYDTQYQNSTTYSSSLGLSSSFNYGEDLTYEGTIDTAFISGSTGGTFNQYNVLSPYQSSSFIVTDAFIIDLETPINCFTGSATIVNNNPIDNNFSWDPNSGELITYFYGDIKLNAFGTDFPADAINIYFSSSQNNIIDSFTNSAASFDYTTSIISCSYGERFSLWIEDGGGGPNLINITFSLLEIYPYSNQTWPQYYTGSTGVSTIIHSTQDEFYDGELPGTEYVVTDGELNPDNDFKYPTTFEVYYDPTLYLSSITPLENFLNINTSPNQGEIYLWFDTGSNSTSGGRVR
jgi:hypothetical protein